MPVTHAGLKLLDYFSISLARKSYRMQAGSRLLQGPAPIDTWQRVAGVPAGATTCSNSTRYSPTTISVIDAPHALDSPYHRKPNVRSWPEPT